jgi:threonyl-tRNA synthetase
LSGLTRVTKFHQDDGHIFCRSSQIRQEIKSSLEFIKRVYIKLGFSKFEMSLSTRPKQFMGEISDWEHAEDSLRLALDDTLQPWTTKEGDGAFYGPKIDITLKDALNRSHQTATIQLDFQLPTRFNLTFMDEEGQPSKPVIIHRAVLGSLERMLAILIENYAGKWPFWLSPRQAIIIPTRRELIGEGEVLLKGFNDYYVDLDRTDNTLSKKVRDAQKLSYNYIFILGDREVENDTLMVRSRSGVPAEKEMNYKDIMDLFKSELKES